MLLWVWSNVLYELVWSNKVWSFWSSSKIYVCVKYTGEDVDGDNSAEDKQSAYDPGLPWLFAFLL